MKVTQQKLKQIIAEEVQKALKEAKKAETKKSAPKKAATKKRDPCEKECTEEVINKKGANWKNHPDMVKARAACMKKCKAVDAALDQLGVKKWFSLTPKNPASKISQF